MEHSAPQLRKPKSRLFMRALLIPPVLAAMLALAGCDIDDFDGGWQHFNRDFHYSYPCAPGSRISVETFNGSVEVSSWDEDSIEIGGTKYGPTQAAADTLRIDIDRSTGSVAIRAVRPVERRNNQGARFVLKVPRTAVIERITSSNGAIHTVDGAGPAHFRTSNGSVRVERLHGRLDAETSNGPIDLVDTEGDALLRTSNGHVDVRGLRGALDATTSNSSITAEIRRTSSDVRAHTNNGSIDLDLPPDFAAGIRAHTSNSSIAVHLPAATNAHVIASTNNDSISSEFEMTVHGEISKTHLEGDIGKGGPLVDLDTSNGGIRILKGGR
ncbi:MAG: DUF4097 family beta strand repeat-containing protein [Bryobacteraceae bacterium]|jgi:hypothetical protein